MEEVIAYRRLIRAWLVGLDTPCGARVYYGWPQDAPSLPMMLYGISRQPVTDYGAPAWSGSLSVTLWGDTATILDPIEALIVRSMANDDLLAAMTDSVVKTILFDLGPIGEDTPTEFWTEDRRIVLSRTIEIPTVFMARKAGW